MFSRRRPSRQLPRFFSVGPRSFLPPVGGIAIGSVCWFVTSFDRVYNSGVLFHGGLAEIAPCKYFLVHSVSYCIPIPTGHAYSGRFAYFFGTVAQKLNASSKTFHSTPTLFLFYSWRVRAEPSFQLGTLSTRIANILYMTPVNVVT